MRTNPLVATLAAASILLTAACTKQTVIVPQPASSSLAPALVVEQFLRAANAAAANDSNGVLTMGRLLGNRNGPVADQWPRTEVQQRMFLAASILKHDGARITGEQLVPGRLNDAKQFNVELTIGARKVTVPFVMVLSKAEQWLIECIELEHLTNTDGTASIRCVNAAR
jgi:hypothetical protein